MKIVFFGTPDFAVASLKLMLEEGIDVAAVVTAPDKPAGRGQQLQQPAVKKFAVEKGLFVLQPEKLKNPGFIDQLQAINADLFVIIAFRMLPEVVWSMPRLGSVNLHGSLLPQYRGAAPINWAIINGEKETGLTTFFLKHLIDTGNIILRTRVEIEDTDDAGTLHDKMMNEGAKLMVKTLRLIETGKLTIEEQDLSQPAKHAPKIFKDDCRIHWQRTVEENYNFVRGLSPYPAAWTLFGGRQVKIFRAARNYANPGLHGEIATDGKKYLRISCADGWLDIKDLQLEGKKRMGIEEFLRGFDAGKISRAE